MVDGLDNTPIFTDLGGHRILVVDDDPDLADTLSVLLRAYGAEVYKAYSGAVAIELFEQHDP